MKQTITLFVLSISFISLHAQNFPRPGATWIFEMGFNPWIDAGAQKWEFVSGSGNQKTFKVTEKFMNKFGIPGLQTNVTYRTFTYNGDTIWDNDEPLRPIANFSLQVGDSAYTPYYNGSNVNTWNNCDSAYHFISHKGVVTETGTETINGVSSRYYQLECRAESGTGTQVIKFTEASIITGGHWFRYIYSYPGCSPIIDGSGFFLRCYYDAANPQVCPTTVQWYETLNISENAAKWSGKIFPNPTSETLVVSNPESENVNASIADIHGRMVKNGISLKALSENSINLSGLAVGVYVLRIQYANGKTVQERFTVAR